MLQGDANASPPHPNTGGGLTQSYHVNDLVKDSGGLYDASDALANSDADAALVNQCTNLTDTCKASISLLAKDSVGGLSQCSLIAKGAPIHLECAADDKDCKPPAGANVPPQTQACADAAKKAGTTTDDSQKKCPTKCDSTGAPAAGDGGGGGGGNDGGGGGGGGGSDDAGTGGGDSDNVKVQRALEWVNVSMPYCQAANNAYDSTCARTCTRTGAADKPEWNSYRSDCSGLISYAWGLPAPGLTTAGFAPYGNGATTVDASTIQVGDALNKKPRGHIILFAGWVDQASGLARIIEEPNCKSHAIDHQSTLTANGATFKRSGTEYVPIRQ